MKPSRYEDHSWLDTITLAGMVVAFGVAIVLFELGGAIGWIWRQFSRVWRCWE